MIFHLRQKLPGILLNGVQTTLPCLKNDEPIARTVVCSCFTLSIVACHCVAFIPLFRCLQWEYVDKLLEKDEPGLSVAEGSQPKSDGGGAVG